MKKLLVTAAILCILVSAEADDLKLDSTLVRNAIVVTDVDISKHFYQSAFGFIPGFDGDISGDWVSQLLQLEASAKVRFAVLTGAMQISGRDVTGAMLGLMQVDAANVGNVERVGGQTFARGEVVLAVVTNDIEGVHAALRKLEADILVPPAQSPNGKELELVVRDPDGVRIHVVQRLLDLPDTRDE